MHFPPCNLRRDPDLAFFSFFFFSGLFYSIFDFLKNAKSTTNTNYMSENAITKLISDIFEYVVSGTTKYPTHPYVCMVINGYFCARHDLWPAEKTIPNHHFYSIWNITPLLFWYCLSHPSVAHLYLSLHTPQKFVDSHKVNCPTMFV